MIDGCLPQTFQKRKGENVLTLSHAFQCVFLIPILSARWQHPPRPPPLGASLHQPQHAGPGRVHSADPGGGRQAGHRRHAHCKVGINMSACMLI